MNSLAAGLATYETDETQQVHEHLTQKCSIPAPPRVACDAKGHVIEPVAEGDHDLNISKAYASWNQGFSHIREITQNWYDRTLELLGGPPTALQDTGWSSATGPYPTRVLWHEKAPPEGGRPTCAGFVLEQIVDAQTAFIQFTNFATELPKDALILGCSRKASTDAAGAYGEGMKVEINCLLAKGGSVRIYTGRRLWEFRHDLEPGSTEPKLFMHATDTHDHCGHLSICIHVRREAFGEKLVDRAKFLFFQPMGPGQPMDPARRGGDVNVEVLLHKEHWGKVYARGIFVCEAPDLRRLGLNFVAGLRNHKAFRFNRDRDSIDVPQLVSYLPVAFLHVRRARAAFYEQLLAHMYVALDAEKDGLGAVAVSFGRGFSMYCKTLRGIQQVADDFVTCFNQLHKTASTPFPYPVAYPSLGFPATSDLQEEVTEAEFLQCSPIRVSEPLHRMLHQSAHCPSLDKLWQEREAAVFELPDWEPDQGSKAMAERFVNVALEWFGNALSRDQLRYKVFPAGNARAVVPGLDSTHRRFFAVDVTLLRDAGATHKWIRKHYATKCIDPVQDNRAQCGGACTLLRYADALLVCLQKAQPHLRQELEKRQKLAMMRMQTRDLPNVQRPPTPPPDPRDPLRDPRDPLRPGTPSTARAPAGAAGGAGAGAGASGDAGGPAGPSLEELQGLPVSELKQRFLNYGTEEELSGCEKRELAAMVHAFEAARAEQAGSASSSSGSRKRARPEDAGSVPAKRRDAVRSAEQQAVDTVRRCLTGTGGPATPVAEDQAIRSAGVAALRAAASKDCYSEGQSALQLAALSSTAFPEAARAALPLYHEGEDEAGARRLGCDGARVRFMAEFAGLAGRLASAVFGLADPRACVRVFWEDAERIAFNWGGRVFLNALYAAELRHVCGPALTCDGWCYWYVIFCHELAHNAASGHDKAHEAAEETLIISFMGRLRSLLTEGRGAAGVGTL